MASNEPVLDFSNTQVAYKAKSDKDLKRARFLFNLLQSPILSTVGQSLMRFSVRGGLPVNGLIKATLYKQFIGGETIQHCADLAKQLHQYDVAAILDYAMEGKEDEEAFKQIMEEFKRNIDLAGEQPNVPASVFKPSAIARNAVLERLSHKSFNEWNEEDQQAYHTIKERFETIFDHAYAKGVPVMVDAEESWIQSIIDYLVIEMMKQYNARAPIVVNTYQLYRKGRLSVLKTHFEEARALNLYFGAKLVRGAYLEQERERAAEKGYDSPVYETKEETDRDYDAAMEYCIAHAKQIYTVIACHNENSSLKAARTFADKGLNHEHQFIWFSQLYGMADHISFNLAESGFNVAKYIPYGPVKAVVPYLIRRAEENSSVQGQVKREMQGIKEELKRRKNGDK